ncbi:MAG: hypothetical protein EPN84_02545 [Legionella sp.]|nr:MAG: hypothetical protein EPN84_02545 [Legionella sp.]
MVISWGTVRTALKGYCIEVVAISMSFLADYLLRDPEQGFDAIRFAIDLRIYYLSKNLINLADTLISRKVEYRHLYGAAFNVAVAAALHPASRLPQTSSTMVNQLTTESLVYTCGIIARLMIEMPLEKQWINQYLWTHKGKLFTGSSGVLCSLIPYFGISSPAFYWSGELIDTWRSKNEEESFGAHLITAKANIPIQVIIGKLIKVCVKAAGETIPFPDFLIDAMAGITHRIVVDLSAVYASKTAPQLPIHNSITQNNAAFFHNNHTVPQNPKEITNEDLKKQEARSDNPIISMDKFKNPI